MVDCECQPDLGPATDGVRFLQALFGPDDLVLFRPIETWTENGKKRSRVVFGHTVYRPAEPTLLYAAVNHQLEVSEREQTNLFFGVCPRKDGQGRFDLAWQIRTVNALWADIDHVSVEDALARVAAAGLPDPSAAVNSGGGTHCYWRLAEPYRIDDAPDPPPVQTEWLEENGKRTPRRYFVNEDGEQIDAKQKGRHPKLSPKALLIQDILGGIAAKIGGDHTTDLSRLLRVPGSLNRKDQRSGRVPRPCTLVELDSERRYTIEQFEALAAEAPDAIRRKKIEAMPLPQPRKISPSKSDKFAELIAASGLAEAGSRSEADFAVCCFAIRNGIAKEAVWSQVAGVGKFAEQGERYFDLTWDNAEYDARAATFEKLQKSVEPKGRPIPATSDAGSEAGWDAPDGDDEGGGARPRIVVDAATTPVADTLHQVTDQLLAAGNCFSRAEQLVAINDQQISPILSSPELAGLLNQHVEFYFLDSNGGEYKPFPSSYANTWLNHHGERARLPVIKLFTRNPAFTEDWRLVGSGFDAASGIYYAGPLIEPRNGTGHLDALLRDFCFKSPADRTNYLGMLLTTLLIPRFIGTKPAALFNGNQPGLGKSILAQIIAILRDGQQAETASYNPNDEEFEKRLGAIVRRGVTTIIIDNAKSRGRNPRIESACLERSITDPVLSFRLLGQSASIRAENSHLFCITANTPDVSRDLVTRSVVINLHHEGDPSRRTFSIDDPEGYVQQHRQELLGELIGMVERWKAIGSPLAQTHSRFNKRGWGNIVGGILEACGEPDFLANAEEAAAQLDDTHREFVELVGVLVDHPRGVWTAAELVEVCSEHKLLADELGEGSERSLATKMGALAGRFIDTEFPLPDGCTATFHRSENRKGKVYQVSVQEKVPNL